MLRRLTGRPRRILMTVDAVGGVWQYATALAQQLVLAGDSVVMAGLGPLPSEAQRREAETLGTLVWLETPPDWMAGGESELDRFPDEIAALVRDHSVEIVHLNAPTLAAGLRLPCPVIAASHSCVSTWMLRMRGERPTGSWAWHFTRNRAGFESADLAVAPSAAHAAMLQECYGALDRLNVIHNAAATRSDEEARDQTVFAAARWWDEGKNGGVLDRAAAKCRWPVFAAGPVKGPNGAALTFSNATSLGGLDHEDTRKRMARCGIFVSPSIYEPFGLAALEAAQGGAPLVLSDIPTYRELWDGAALFFPPDDADALADALDLLATDPAERNRLGTAARRHSARYTLAKQASATRRVYDRAEAAFVQRQ